MKKQFLVIFSIALFAHCATPPKIVDTQALKSKPAPEREQAYKENVITPGGMFTAYKVGESPYPGESLSPLFEAPYASQRAKDLYSSGNTWNTFASVFGAAGGFMIGYNAGTALRGADTNAGVWIGGGAAIVAAFVFAGVADGKFSEASKLYNDDLYKALELQQKTSAVKPQEQFPHYTMAIRHSF